MRHRYPEINAGSMADIAFLLLIFFLVTTTMNLDKGITRILPPAVKESDLEKTEKIKKRNILPVLINFKDELLVAGKNCDINNLRNIVKEFILNTENNPEKPEKELLSVKLEKAKQQKNTEEINQIRNAINLLGDIEVSKAIISLQSDRNTSYETYLKVQSELTLAYYELRDALALEHYGKKFIRLQKNYADAIKLIYPVTISEAEPVTTKQ